MHRAPFSRIGATHGVKEWNNHEVKEGNCQTVGMSMKMIQMGRRFHKKTPRAGSRAARRASEVTDEAPFIEQGFDAKHFIQREIADAFR